MVGVCSNLILDNTFIILLRVVSFPGDSWYPVALVFVAAGYFIYKKEYIAAGIIALAPLIGNMVKSLTKNYFQIPRPAEFGCKSLGEYGDIYAFPSGHTIFATIFFGFMAFLILRSKRKVLAIIPFAWVLLMGASRYLLGAHWAIDIIGGYMVGGSILTVAIMVYTHYSYEKRKKAK